MFRPWESNTDVNGKKLMLRPNVNEMYFVYTYLHLIRITNEIYKLRL